jgi:subtilisin family serine protease
MTQRPLFVTLLFTALLILVPYRGHAYPCEFILDTPRSLPWLDEAAARAGLEVRATYTRLLSGLAVRGNCVVIADFARNHGLTQTPIAHFAPSSDGAANTPPIGPGPLGEAFGLRGAGVDVALIDAGVDYLHPAFGGSALPEDDRANDPTTLDDLPLPAGLLGTDLAGADGDSPDPDPFPDASPEALADPLSPVHHGTALASVVRAIAPDARLFAYKILARDAPTARLDTLLSALELAVDPNDDGAFDDAPDILLLAWAGLDEALGPAPSALALALDALHDRGVLVVTPAGNRGPAPAGIASPCAVDSTLCVAATYPPGLAMPVLEVTSPPYLEGPSAVRPSPPGLGLGLLPQTRRIGRLVDAGDACGDVSRLPNLRQEIALFIGGDCDHGPAIEAAVEAQAEAVLLIAPPHTLDLWQPRGRSNAEMPVALIAHELGRDFREGLAQAFPIEVELRGRPEPIEGIAYVLTAFSARGPSRLEGPGPDLAAPGYGIEAALAGPGSRTASLSGTSLAAAHAAGVLALLAEHTDAEPADLSALAVQSALPVQAPARPFTAISEVAPLRSPLTRGGAGLISLARAIKQADAHILAFGPATSPQLALGLIFASKADGISAPLTLVNRGEAPVTLDSEIIFRDSQDLTRGVSLGLSPTQVTIPAGGSAEVTLDLAWDPRRFEPWRLRPASRWSADPSPGDRLTDSEIDGFLRFAGGDADLSVPFTLLPRPTSDIHAEASCLVPENFNLTLHNASDTEGPTELFTLGTTDPVELNLAGHLDLAAAGIRQEDNILEFAIATHGSIIGPDRTLTLVNLDTDLDGHRDVALANLPSALLEPGLDSGTSRSVVLIPSPDGALDLAPIGGFELGPTLFTRVDLVGRARILSADTLALGVTGTRPFRWWVELYDVDSALTVTDVLPGDLGASDRLNFDPTCGTWEFASASLLTETFTRVTSLRAPSCEFSGRDGVMAVHLGNAPERDFEALTPPTEAVYACASEMVGSAHFETCATTPRWNDFIEGACAASAFVESDARSYPVGRSPASLTITDYWGHKTTCDTEVLIEDLTPPVVDCGKVDRIGADMGMLPYRHEVGAFDNCSRATAEVVGWRCLIHEGGELRYDVSPSCDVSIDGDQALVMRDLGRVATLVEWTVIATDETGNEEQTQCYAYIDRELIQAVGGAGCQGGARSSTALLVVLLVVLNRATRRRQT